MAGPNKPLTREQVMQMTGMSAETFDKRTASAKGPQQDGTWDKKSDRLSPSDGGGTTSAFKKADESTVPLNVSAELQAHEAAAAPAAEKGVPEVTRQRMIKAGLGSE